MAAAAIAPQRPTNSRSGDRLVIGNQRAHVLVITHLEPVRRVLAEQGDIGGIRAVADGQRAAGACLIRRIAERQRPQSRCPTRSN